MKTTIPSDPRKLAAWLKRPPTQQEMSESTAPAPAARKPGRTLLRESAAADGGTMKLELREFTILQ